MRISWKFLNLLSVGIRAKQKISIISEKRPIVFDGIIVGQEVMKIEDYS